MFPFKTLLYEDEGPQSKKATALQIIVLNNIRRTATKFVVILKKKTCQSDFWQTAQVSAIWCM